MNLKSEIIFHVQITYITQKQMFKLASDIKIIIIFFQILLILLTSKTETAAAAKNNYVLKYLITFEPLIRNASKSVVKQRLSAFTEISYLYHLDI